MSIQRPTTNDPEVLNLGCGEDYRDGAWNVDASFDVDADERVDLEQTPWPWADSSFSTVIAYHVLEHLDPVPWAELCRVLKPGGTLKIRYPIGTVRFEDPTHRQYWNWHTAEAIAGERKHGHEHVPDLEIDERSLKWDCNTLGFRAYTSWRLFAHGPGPWLSQIPGLHGEVKAIYSYKP